MVRLGVVAVLLATTLSACVSIDGEPVGESGYGTLVDACDLLDQATVGSLDGGIPERTVDRTRLSGRARADDVDSTQCGYEFGVPATIPSTPYDVSAPNAVGTPEYRSVTVTVMRFRDKDGKSGLELARRWLDLFRQDPVPDLAVLGFDDGSITQHDDGVSSYTQVRVIGADLVLEIEYGGANSDAKPPGMPGAESRAGALRLLVDAASRK